MYENILKATGHRKTPLPDGPWLLTQKWENLLFMHQPVDNAAIARLLPEGLELDTYNGQAWITIISFQINNMRFRKTPPLPFIHSFLELNVRTYVKRDGIKGIYFFSLDASKLPAVIGARLGTLPYFHANMKKKQKKGVYYFSSKRNNDTKAAFRASYRPVSEGYYPEEGSLSHWLLERYFLWSYRNESLTRVGIHHYRWQVSDAEALIEKDNLTPFLKDEEIRETPIFHYVSARRVLFWPVEKVD